MGMLCSRSAFRTALGELLVDGGDDAFCDTLEPYFEDGGNGEGGLLGLKEHLGGRRRGEEV